MNDRAARMQRLKQALATRAFVRASETEPIESGGILKTNGEHWLFDIRAIVMSAPVLDDITHLFWETFKDRSPVQVGGLETGAIPLVAALVTAGARDFGLTDMSGFFVRKSRKREGLMRMIEGELRPGAPVILVDDLVNQGNSFRRQVEALEALGHKVTDVWTLVRFRDREYYTYFAEKGITVHSLFELNDFASLNVRNLTVRESRPIPSDYRILWKFSSGRPSRNLVVSKSDPAIDEQRVYVGSDHGVMWALDQTTGAIVWQHQIGFHPKGKGIFSSPIVHDGTVYFGGYDGNVYALDAVSGKKKWISLEADWIGSSPAIAPKSGTLFIGLEYGLWRRRGGIAAIDMKTGKTKWRYAEMPCYTHATPCFIGEHNQVAIGSNDGCAYLFDAETGTLIWKISTGPLTTHELNTGFSQHDIKESVAYDAKRDLVIVANMSGSIFFIDRASGAVRSVFKAEFGFFSTPLIHGDCVYASSIGKYLYCIDLDTFNEKWRWYGGARIFGSPTVIEGSIYLGTNTGRMTALDPLTGAERSMYAFTERITNRIAFNPTTRRFFVPTFANEIYCVERKA